MDLAYQRRLVRLVAASALIATAATASTMKQVAAAIPIPEDIKPVKLSGLVYQTMAWTGQVRTVRLEEPPDAGAKEVTWIVQASNTRGSRMRIDVELHLLDAADERIASGRKTLLIGASTTDAEDKIKIKLTPGVWERAEELRILVQFK